MSIKNKIANSFLAVLLGIFVSSIIMTLTGNGFFTLINYFLQATILDLSNFGNWLMMSSILILTGLSVAFSYRAGLFNIGAEGQFIVGAFTAAYFGVVLDLPPFIGGLVIFILATFFGALYGMIPGILKAYFKVSEVVVTIMLNWIALELVNGFVQNSFHSQSNATVTPEISSNASLHSNFLSNIFDGANMHIGFIFMIILVIMYWFIFEKMKFGYQIKAVGFNPYASKYAGIKDKSIIIKTMTISGLFSGAAGAIYVLGTVGHYTTGAFLNYGFDGITVAFLGQISPIGMIFSGLLLGGLRSAGILMLQVPKEIIDVTIAIILIFVALAPVIFKKLFKGRK